jgi:hypothetical protein
MIKIFGSSAIGNADENNELRSRQVDGAAERFSARNETSKDFDKQIDDVTEFIVTPTDQQFRR